MFTLIGFGLLTNETVAGLSFTFSTGGPGYQVKNAASPRAQADRTHESDRHGIMLITGIITDPDSACIFTLGWLTAKIGFFAIAIVSGVLFG